MLGTADQPPFLSNSCARTESNAGPTERLAVTGQLSPGVFFEVLSVVLFAVATVYALRIAFG
jgi:hypothetical protein